VATLLLIPKDGYDASNDADTFRKIPDMAARAAKGKQHFLVTIDPSEYEVFASMGQFEKVEVDGSGMIRLNMTMFEPPDGTT
jgi:hypothetical protein